MRTFCGSVEHGSTAAHATRKVSKQQQQHHHHHHQQQQQLLLLLLILLLLLQLLDSVSGVSGGAAAAAGTAAAAKVADSFMKLIHESSRHIYNWFAAGNLPHAPFQHKYIFMHYIIKASELRKRLFRSASLFRLRATTS